MPFKAGVGNTDATQRRLCLHNRFVSAVNNPGSERSLPESVKLNSEAELSINVF
jgi:hypothetical protein